jgi:hypothetical protein
MRPAPKIPGSRGRPKKPAPGYPGGPWAAYRRAAEARTPLLKEARRRTRTLLKGNESARAKFLSPVLEGILLSALLIREALEKHGLGKRGAKLEWARLMTESSQVIARLLDRLPEQALKDDPDAQIGLNEYLEREDAKRRGEK